jgi:transposase
MNVVFERCAGLDVHKKSVMTAMRCMKEGKGLVQEVRGFGTMTCDILALGDWLEEHGVTHVAMESTGVYWKPLFNLLEDRFTVVLVNAKHVRQVPGRKTDVKDCQWLAQLLQFGLLEGSFIPPRPQRELRELTRHRTQATRERNRVANRIQKVLEDANIKLASVATDVLGVSGRAMLEAIIAGEAQPEEMAELARQRLWNKLPALKQALEGRVTEHHRFMLRTLYEHWQYLGNVLGELEERIDAVIESDAMRAVCEETDSLPFAEAVRLLDTVPGIDVRGAQTILAEIGTNMDQFPSAAHLASWTGVSPGNNESAGKRRTGKTTQGNRWLKAALTQNAWAASRTRNTYLSARYRRLASRRGRKRAAMGIAHSILVSIYHMLEQHVAYVDLGPEHLAQLDPKRLIRYHTKRLETFGFEVTLQPKNEAA